MHVGQPRHIHGVEAVGVRLGREGHVRHPPEEVAGPPPHELYRLRAGHHRPQPVQRDRHLPVLHEHPADLGGHPLGPPKVEDEQREVADREALRTERAGCHDYNEPCADVLYIGEDGVEALAKQGVLEGGALALGVEPVEAAEHPLLGVGHLDGLSGAEHLPDEPGHVPGSLTALLAVPLYPPAHHVDDDHDDEYGNEDAEGHQRVDTSHDEERHGQEEHVGHEELELGHVLGYDNRVVAEAADGLSRGAGERAVPRKVHQVGEGVALKHRSDVEIAELVEHHAAYE